MNEEEPSRAFFSSLVYDLIATLILSFSSLRFLFLTTLLFPYFSSESVESKQYYIVCLLYRMCVVHCTTISVAAAPFLLVISFSSSSRQKCRLALVDFGVPEKEEVKKPTPQ